MGKLSPRAILHPVRQFPPCAKTLRDFAHFALAAGTLLAFAACADERVEGEAGDDPASAPADQRGGGDEGPKTALEPWEPIDPAFAACAESCGERATGGPEGEKPRGVVSQPGAVRGDETYCPVSGVVFEVSETTPERSQAGEVIHLCCEACAEHYEKNRASVAAARGYR